jgi:hypothetical protein
MSNPIFTSGTPGAATSKQYADYYFNAQFAPDFLHNSEGAYPNPIFSVGPPNPNPNPNSSQFTPKPFMTPGMTFQPRTQFGQQASAPLNINQQGKTYGQMPGGPITAQQLPAFQYVRPGEAYGSVPQFQNPFAAPEATSVNTIGADIARNALLNRGFNQANVSGMNANQLAAELSKINPRESYKIVNFADGGLTGTDNMTGTTGMGQQFQNPFGPQQPQQPQSMSIGGTQQQQQPGLPGLLSVGAQNQYPQGYTPIGQPPQNLFSLNVPRN